MIRKSARPWLLIAATLSLWSTFRPSPAPAQTVSFVRSDIAAGFDHPIAVAVGDFNADGLQDLAVANHDSNTVSVLLGVGNGDFQEAPQSPIAVGTTPVWIAVGDFNGDGKPDLAVANVNSDTVSVLLGNGDGTFQAAQTFAVGDGPTSVTAGDFNRDGVQDLATGNWFSGDVSVLLGIGNRTFEQPASLPSGVSVISPVVGDFDGDGKLDLAVANYSNNNISVFWGNGDGTFQQPPLIVPSGGALPNGVVVGDFDGDHKLDLAVANSGNPNLIPPDPGNVAVLLGNGDRTFQAPQTYAVGHTPLTVAVGDFDGDRVPDLAVANFGDSDPKVGDPGNVAVLLGNGDGTFQAPQPFAVGTNPQFVAVGDFNGDRVDDLAVANFGDKTVSVLLNATVKGPTITTQPVSQTVTAGQPATFSVTATGTAPLSYQWQKGVTPISGATGASYITPLTTGGDNGALFRVVVSNAAGSVTSTAATLTVNSPPTITTQPASQTVTAGQPATFSVSATGTAPLSYQWQKGVTPISGATGASYITPPTTGGDNGALFRVVVSNAAGSVTSTAATLTVVLPTLSSLSLSPSTVTGGSPSTGTVMLSAPAPSDGVAVSLSSNKPSVASVPSSVTVLSGARTATFTLSTNPVGTSTLVTISASYGTVTLTANLTVAASSGDVTAPILSLPGNMVVTATSLLGAIVTFNVSATDNVDPSPRVRCTPPSGSIFRIGITTVTCTATDAAGNVRSGSFLVTVVRP